jgi:hypothetical protein
VTNQSVNIRLPAELHRRLAALAAEGIFGKPVEKVVVHLTRNALLSRVVGLGMSSIYL